VLIKGIHIVFRNRTEQNRTDILLRRVQSTLSRYITVYNIQYKSQIQHKMEKTCLYTRLDYKDQ
jgi:hypothetical protein